MANSKRQVVVVGLGEVGKPLFTLISRQYETVGVDIKLPADKIDQVSVLHLCFPFEVKDFVGESAGYIEKFKPELTIINSTVGVGTTRAIAERTGAHIVDSPVRGKHIRMLEELTKYTKFIGPIDAESGRQAAQHFASIGMKTKVLSSPEATEVAKLTETTYFGLMIAWAQELERYCDQAQIDYDEVNSFYEEINFFPSVKYFPGVIGGHCVMPNIEILGKFQGSQLLDAIRFSNQMKIERDARLTKAADTSEKVTA